MCFLASSVTVTGFEYGFWQAAPFLSFQYCIQSLNLLVVHSARPYRPTFTPGLDWFYCWWMFLGCKGFFLSAWYSCWDCGSAHKNNGRLITWVTIKTPPVHLTLSCYHHEKLSLYFTSPPHAPIMHGHSLLVQHNTSHGLSSIQNIKLEHFLLYIFFALWHASFCLHAFSFLSAVCLKWLICLLFHQSTMTWSLF